MTKIAIVNWNLVENVSDASSKGQTGIKSYLVAGENDNGVSIDLGVYNLGHTGSYCGVPGDHPASVESRCWNLWKDDTQTPGALTVIDVAEVANLTTPAEPEKKAAKCRVSVARKGKGGLNPQAQKVLHLLKAKGSTTALEAGGVYRVRSLSRRILDLKEAGYTVVTKLSVDTTGQRYARYYLKGEPAAATEATTPVAA